jgi:PAS domain S-box-containing protein
MEGRWLRVNQKFCEILGYNEAELMALNVKAITHPDDWDTSARQLRLLREGVLKYYSLEKRYIRKNRSFVWVNVTVSLVGDHWFNVGVVEDITARKMMEEELNRLNEELEARVAERTAELEAEAAKRVEAVNALLEKDRMLIHQSRMAAMGEMLGNIAHQWRQPLNVLGLKVQQIGLCHEVGAFSKELLDANIAKAMEILLHLSQTIDDFGDFSAPDKGKSLFEVDPVVAKTISLLDESFRVQRISIDVSTAGKSQIEGFPNGYGQVLFNIFMNARDAFVEQGTETARITVRSWTEDGKAVLTVTDNAGGIEEGIIDKIFDAYFTTKELGKGTGIGLFMAKNIIEKDMGGRLTVYNVAGGAEFRIEI